MRWDVDSEVVVFCGSYQQVMDVGWMLAEVFKGSKA